MQPIIGFDKNKNHIEGSLLTEIFNAFSLFANLKTFSYLGQFGDLLLEYIIER